MRWLKTYGLPAVLVMALVAFAQPPIPELTVNPDTVRIGDPVEVRLFFPGITSPDSLVWPEVDEQIGDLTVLNADTTIGKAARKQGGASIEWTVAVYDTGSFKTGPLEFEMGGQPWTLPGDSIRVASILSDTAQVDLRPLKAQEDLPITIMDILKWYGPWVLGALVVAALVWLALTWWNRRKRKTEEGAEEIPLPPPYEQAKAALEELRRDNPLARGDMKTYVTKLVFIVKRLAEREHGDPVLEMTSTEVRRWVKTRSLPFDTKDLQKLLTASDTVKFARGTLDGKTAENLLSITERIVESYRPVLESLEGNSPERDADSNDVSVTKIPRGGSVGAQSRASAEPAESASWSISSSESPDRTPSDDQSSETEETSDTAEKRRGRGGADV